MPPTIRVRRALVPALTTAALLTLAGCGSPDGITTSTGTLSNAEAFLTDATKEFTASLEGRDDVNVLPEAACFYVLNDEDHATGIACGGARELGTAEGETWQMAAFGTSGTGEDQTAQSLTFKDGWSARPSTVVDADGEAAPDALDDVSEPDLPQAAAGLVVTDDLDSQETEGEPVEPGPEGVVRVPSGTVSIDSVATVPVLVGDDGSMQAPAEGETFLLISWSSDLDAGPPAGSTKPLPLPSISVTGRSEPIVDLATATEANGTFLVSAADDTDLLVTADGAAQHVALPEGTRVADPATDALYNDPADVSEALTFKAATGNLDGQSFKITHEATVDTVQLTAWTPGQGWASNGNAWLVVTTTSSEGHDVQGNPKVLPKGTRQTWTVTVDDKQVGSPASLTVTLSSEPGEVVFEVPADTTAATLTAAAVTQYVDGTVFKGAVMTADHGTASVDLTLP